MKGWQSPRYCIWPQELVFQLDNTVRLRKIQILAHQYKIPTKIEFLIGVVPPELIHSNVTYKDCQFVRLGHVSLEDNRSTNFQTRELKSVHVDCVCRFVRILVHKNHINELNLYNQVGIVALNMIGDGSSVATSSSNSNLMAPGDNMFAYGLPQTYTAGKIDQIGLNRGYDSYGPDLATLGMINKLERVSFTDDIAFNVYQDSETATVLRQLAAQKEAAIKSEDYVMAGYLKNTISTLQAMGEELGRLDKLKHDAVAKEDFKLAATIKQQVFEYRQRVYASLGINSSGQPVIAPVQVSKKPHEIPSVFLDNHRQEIRSAQLPRQTPENPITLPTLRASSMETLNDDDRPIKSKLQQVDDVPLSPQTSTKDEKSKIKNDDVIDISASAEVNPVNEPEPVGNVIAEGLNTSTVSVNYDDRPLNNNQSKKAVALEEYPSKASDEPTPLDEKTKEEYTTSILAFGENTVRNLLAKPFNLRSQAGDDVLAALKNKGKISSLPQTTLWSATMAVVKLMLQDHLAQIWMKGAEVLKHFLTQTVRKGDVSRSDLVVLTETCIPLLIAKCGDTNLRNREGAADFLIEMSSFPPVEEDGDAYFNVITRKIKPKAVWREAQVQLDVLSRLVEQVGCKSNEQLSVSSLTSFVVPCFKHVKKEVRDAATQLVVAIYKKTGVDISGQLDLDTQALKTVSEAIAKVAPPASPTKGGKPASKAKLRAASFEPEEEIKEVSPPPKQTKNTKKVVIDDPRSKGPSPEPEVQSPPPAKKAAAPAKDTKAKAKEPPKEEPKEETKAQVCIFCGVKDKTFNEETLDVHYWKSCRMLKQCKYCKTVVEVSALHDHWLKECTAKRKMKLCPRCKEVKHEDHYADHVKHKTCRVGVAPTIASRCPLCHTDIPVGDEGWREHLLKPGNCVKQIRNGSAASTGSHSQLPISSPPPKKAPAPTPVSAAVSPQPRATPAPQSQLPKPAAKAGVLRPPTKTGIPMPRHK